MKKLFLYSILFATGISFFASCDDEDSITAPEADRLFMPMFRTTYNTASTTTPFYCDIAQRVDENIKEYLISKGHKTSNHVNDMRLFWYEVDGAVGYEIKGKIQGQSWEKEENPNLMDTILVGGDINTFLHEDLQYSTGYWYAIRALASLDNPNDPRHSKWFGYGDGGHQHDHSRDDERSAELKGALNTGDRYEVPSIFWTENITENSMDVCFNPAVEGSYESDYAEFFEAGGAVQDGKWVFDEIRVEPSADNPLLPVVSVKPTAAEMAAGRVHIEGLESNAAYIVKGQNNNIARYFDRQYNSTMVRMKGELGEPILIKANTAEEAKQDTILQNMGTIQGKQFGVKDLVATRIDTILTNYMKDNTIAEGQIFYLEGGKTYYTHQTVEMTKGFTLATNPEDLAAGKGRATVLQGVGYSNETMTATNANNWGLCRNAASGAENGVVLAIQPIIFEDINFRPWAWYNYFDQKGSDGNNSVTINGNYFMNMYSQGLSFILNELRVSRCAMSGHVRGFIRFQGPNRQIIEKLTVEDCVFYDCGGYSNDTRGYSWFAGPGKNRNSNFYKNLTIRNNSFIDSGRHALVTENGNLAWPAGATWNIDVSNNTFVNLCIRNNNKSRGLLFEIAYPPKGSKITCKKNLFVFVGNKNDVARDYYMKGMIVKTTSSTYDFADNYSTVVPAYQKYRASNDPNRTTLIDGIFSASSFSNSSTGAGYLDGFLNASGYEETMIKFGDNYNGNEPDAVGYQLTAEELFQNPWTIGTVTSSDLFEKDAYRHADISGFYYNNTDRVKNHPIYTKQIGAPCWRTGESWDGGNNITVKSGDK